MNNKLIVGAVMVVGVAAIVGAYFFPSLPLTAGSPTTGSTFNTAKVAGINMAPNSASATSSSLYNGDANDRIVLDAYVTCSGVSSVFAQTSAGVSTWVWQAATTSTNAPAVLPSVVLAAMNMTVATATASSFAATSTYTNNFARIWNAGSYLTFVTNATSSASACQPGVHYVAL